MNSNTVSITASSSSLTVSVSPVAPLNLVLNQVQVFTATVSGGNGTLSYQWYLDGEVVSGQTSSTYTYTPVLGPHGIQVNVTDSAFPLVIVRSNLVIFSVSVCWFCCSFRCFKRDFSGCGYCFSCHSDG